MADPLLSVLLPCCNGAATLGPALQSVLSQTFADFELIFLNDGSTDQSVEIARSFNDARIRVIGGAERCGLPIRLNQGVAQARGQFIARMDADDICFPERFEKQLAFLQAHPEVDLLGCRAVVFRGKGETIGLLPFAATHERLCAQPWRNIPLPHPSWMGRRSWFLRHPYRLPEVRRAEDQELLLRSSKDSRFACLEDVLLAYRQGQFQLQRTLIARRALLTAQLGLFFKWREWQNALLALASAAAKVAVDCLSALPGLQKLFFARMGAPVSESTRQQLALSLAQYGMRGSQDTSSTLVGVRIARISTVPFFIVAQLKTQIAALVAQGAEVTVVSSNGAEVSNQGNFCNAGWRVIEIPRALSPLKDLCAIWQLFLFFRRSRIQVAHSTTPKAGLLTAIAAAMAGVPVRLHTFTGQPWVSMRGLSRWLVRSCDRFIQALSTVCYTDSESQRAFLIHQGQLAPDKLKVIGSGSLAGVDLARFSRTHFPLARRNEIRAGLGIPLHATVILFVGRITAEKGMHELMRAFAKLKDSGESVAGESQACKEAHLVIVGPFDDSSGVPGHITSQEITRQSDTHLVGYTQCPESYMAISDVLCLPSYREGFGTVVIEAAAMGLPTVGTDIYGLSDAVVNGVTGLLVPSHDSDALEAALRRLLSDDALRSRMGSAAFERAQTLFASGHVNALQVQEYASLLGQANIAIGGALP